MVITKKRLSNKGQVCIGTQQLERVQNYTYLGINVSNKGNFAQCKKTLRDKGRKAMNKLKGLISGSNIRKGTALKMFDQLVLPILSYGSEIWAAQDFTQLLRTNNKKSIEELYMKLPQEKLNIHYCKYILGVSAKATNAAVMAEVGRYPLYIKIVSQMIKYYYRVKEMGENSLVGQALHEMETQEHQCKNSWISVVKKILLDMPVQNQRNAQNPGNSISRKLRIKLENQYAQHWREKLHSGSGKLDMYRQIKTEFQYEEYLDCPNSREGQIALTRLRVSNHRLRIETGRYTKPYTPRENRLCSCGTQVEDEFHFLFQCSLLADIRKLHFGHEIVQGDREALLKEYLANFSVTTPKLVSLFIKEGMSQRTE